MLDLSIVLLKYNRPEWLHGRIVSLTKFFADKEIGYEFIISDNHSQPSMKNFLSKTRSDANYTLVSPIEHLETVEEHYRFVLEHCKGTYTWIIGDDDPPTVQGLHAFLELIIENKFDIAVFDSNRYYSDGILENGSIINSQPNDITKIEDFIKTAGFWYTIAGLSNVVFRTPSQADIVKMDKIIAISPIYAHVFWLVTIFWSKNFRFIPTPLVTYSENGRDDGTSDHWEIYASNKNVFRNYWWTVGFIRLCNFLICEKNLHANWYFDVFEVNWQGLRRRPLLAQIAALLWQEIIAERKLARPVEKKEIEEVVDFLVASNPKYEILESYFSKYEYDIQVIKKNRHKIDEFINSNSEQNLLFDYYIGTYKSFKIYKIHKRYLAVSNYSKSWINEHLYDANLGNQRDSFSDFKLENLYQKIENFNHQQLNRSVEQSLISINENFQQVNQILLQVTSGKSNRLIKGIKKLIKLFLPRKLINVMRRKFDY